MKKTPVRKCLIICGLICSLGAPMPSQEKIQLVGCGSVIPGPLYEAWAQAYSGRNPNVQIKYLPLGSGEAVKQIISGSADFAAGEIPISDQEMKNAGKKIHHLPLFLTAVVPIYNLPGPAKSCAFQDEFWPTFFLARSNFGIILNWQS